MPTEPTQIAIQMYTVRTSPLPYAGKLKKLREIGYRAVQGGPAANLSAEEHKALMDEIGIGMSCFSGGLEDILENPGKYIESCQGFGCDDVMIGTMPTEMRASREGYVQAISLINKAGALLREGGVYLSYHNHAQEFRRFKDGKTGMDLLYDGLNPECVRFMPDTHWLQAGGADILEWINRLSGRMAYLHVKDYRIAPANYLTGIGETEKQFAQIGGGNLPWREIIVAALMAGVRAFIVEQDDCYGVDPFVCAAESYEYLKGLGLS